MLRVFELLYRGKFGANLKSGLPGTGNHPSAGGPEHSIADAQLLTHFFQGNASTDVGHIAQLGGGNSRLFGQIGAQGVKRGSSQVQAGNQRRLHFDIEPALD